MQTNKDQSVKLVFHIPSKDGKSDMTETLWASSVGGGRYQVENSPFLAYDVSYLDIVEAKAGEDGRLMATRVVNRGGHSTYRVMVRKQEEADGLLRRLNNLGATYESSSNQLIAFDVPANAQHAEIVQVLKKGEEDAVWEYEGHIIPTMTTYANRFYDQKGSTKTKHLYAGSDLVATIEGGGSGSGGTSTPSHLHDRHERPVGRGHGNLQAHWSPRAGEEPLRQPSTTHTSTISEARTSSRMQAVRLRR